jgi:hypothetical protein
MLVNSKKPRYHRQMSFSREVPAAILEYVRLETIHLLAEAQESRCQYLRSYVERLSTYAITLHFIDATGEKYSRRINVQPFFLRVGISFERWHARMIQEHIDTTILTIWNLTPHIARSDSTE